MSFGQKSGGQNKDDKQQGGLPPGLRGVPLRTRQASGGRGVRSWCRVCDEDVCVCKPTEREAGS